jgi:hypothetical protein
MRQGFCRGKQVAYTEGQKSMKYWLARLALICGAALSLVNVGAEGCGLSSPSGAGSPDLGVAGNGDGGNCVGFGFGGSCSGGNSDLGEAADLGFIGDSIAMTSPKPFQSLVPLDANLIFEVGVGTSSPSAYEPNITILPYLPGADMGAPPPVTGTFSWKQPTTGPAQLTFIPNAPLTDNTDYTVKVRGPSSGATVLATGFSTGSRPRVSQLILTINPGPAVSLAIFFSEPMDQTSFASHLNALSNGSVLAGTLSTSANGDPTLQFTTPSKIGSSLTVKIDGAVKSAATSGAGLIVQSWDSPTDSMGAFQYTFTGISTSFPSTSVWTPTVN